MRPDHVPLMPGIEEGHDTHFKAKGYFSGKASGYTMMGRLFAVGYMRGLMDAVFGRATSSCNATRIKDEDKYKPAAEEK
jgi:mannonate dehydratase